MPLLLQPRPWTEGVSDIPEVAHCRFVAVVQIRMLRATVAPFDAHLKTLFDQVAQFCAINEQDGNVLGLLFSIRETGLMEKLIMMEAQAWF